MRRRFGEDAISLRHDTASTIILVYFLAFISFGFSYHQRI